MIGGKTKIWVAGFLMQIIERVISKLHFEIPMLNLKLINYNSEFNFKIWWKFVGKFKHTQSTVNFLCATNDLSMILQRQKYCFLNILNTTPGLKIDWSASKIQFVFDLKLKFKNDWFRILTRTNVSQTIDSCWYQTHTFDFRRFRYSFGHACLKTFDALK